MYVTKPMLYCSVLTTAENRKDKGLVSRYEFETSKLRFKCIVLS